ncbi:MAG: hypothetical protein FXV80_01570 [Candidatus Thioglobus sp.]|nr:MAG: hypothetical protein FXV80_01570 [Candidatus Thioglobus sp.]
MTAITFDAIEYMDDLIKAGVSESQAKVQSAALTHAIEGIINRDLATKSDIVAVKNDIIATELRLIKWMIGINATIFGLLVAFFKLLA